MADTPPPSINKWAFFAADMALAGIAFYVIDQNLPVQTVFQTVACTAGLATAAFAAWLWIRPFLVEHDALARRAESITLAESVGRLQNIEAVARQIESATSRWQGVQEAAAKSLSTAQAMTEKMSAEAAEFMKFLDKSNDQEKAHLRLEIEKLRRSEGDWLQIIVGILDHIYALNRAAAQSGQAGLISQLGQFQNACRDLGRRIGLVALLDKAGTPFNDKLHQLPDPQATPSGELLIEEILMPGYSYQGQFLRRALVQVANPPASTTSAEADTELIPQPTS